MKLKEENIIYINTDEYETPKASNTLLEGRENIVQMQYKEGMPEVTIHVQAYNRLDKTKRCVESILRNTKGINYELLLVDNGSTDGTLEYFKQVPYKYKKIMRVTKNVGSGFPTSILNYLDIAPYIVIISNDLILTPNWLHNLLICIKSDKKIGMVNAVSSNVSNLQQVDLPFQTYEEMEEQARRFNCSDPTKWEERVRLITLGTLLRKEALYAVGLPFADVGFFHDFGDDDLSYRMRRMGYKIILAKDTWIHHDHDFRSLEEKDPKEFYESMEIGRQNFMEKYRGIDAWETKLPTFITSIRQAPICNTKNQVRVLGIDVGTGDILLDLKNYLRLNHIFDVALDAFIQDSKYREELCTICDGMVACDREEGIRLYYPVESYDYIILGNVFNSYAEPFIVLQDIMALLKSGGILFLSLENTFNFFDFFNMLGNREKYRENFVYHISLEQLLKEIEEYGHLVRLELNGEELGKEEENMLSKFWNNFEINEKRDVNMARLLTKEFVLTIQKNKNR